MMKTIVALAGLWALLFPAADPEVTAAKVSKMPAIDGKAGDDAWKQAKELEVKIAVPSELDNPKSSITVKAVHDGESVAFLLVWRDKTESVEHEPFEWDAAKKEYVVKDETPLEDMVSLAFPIQGTFSFDMLAGHESKWDVWEWQACRANNGYGRDKHHIYAKSRPSGPGIKAKKFTDRNETPTFIARPEDAGTPPFKKVEAPSENKGPKVPQYVPATPTGSGADLAAKGTYADGQWTVEIKRKLKTGNADDAAFDVSKPVEFAIGVFDQTEGSDHEVSKKIVLKFQN